MKRTALFIAALSLSLTACDSESPDDSEDRLAELDAELDAEEAEGLEEAGGPEGKRHDRARRHGKRGKHNPAAEICEQVACSDAQLEQVQAAFARPERGERPERPERPDMSAANASIATAFAGDSFAAADLQAWRAQLPERPDHGGHHLEKMSELHAILTAEQRSALATKIAAGEAFGGKHDGKHGKRHHDQEAGDDGEGRHAEHLARRVEHFCEPLECSEGQEAQLTEIFERKHADRPERGDKTDRKAALAKAFEAESFDADAIAATMKREHDEGAMDAVVVDIHGVLTAEQRATMSERISEHGPRALMGKHGKRGGKHGKRGKRGDHKGGDCDGDKGDKGGPQFG